MAKKTKNKVKTKKLAVRDPERTSRKFPWLSVLELKVVGKGGYFDSEGAIRNSDDCIRCTSMVKSIGKRCKNFATPGEFTCRIHGGQLARAKSGKVRLYSAFIEDARLVNLYERAQENEELTGIREELSLLRILLAQAIGNADDFDLGEIKSVASSIGEIRQLVKDCAYTEILS